MINSSIVKGKCSIKIMFSVFLLKLVFYDKLRNYIKIIDFNENIIDMVFEFCLEEVNGVY